MDHVMVDDVNIPDCLQGDPNDPAFPDVQNPDNIGPVDDGVVCGVIDLLDNDYDTIYERAIGGVPAIEEYFIDEAKEPRFDTNFLEEKFLEIYIYEEGQDAFLIDVVNNVMGEVLEHPVGWADDRWYGPVDIANWDGTYFADRNGDLVVDEHDVTVYVDGVQVPVLEISLGPAQGGYVKLEQYYGAAWEAEVTIDYGYLTQEEVPATDPSELHLEPWQWLNIETRPWDYTEFVLPELPDITAGDMSVDAKWRTGDYILVSSWMTEDSDDVWWFDPDLAVRMKFVYDAVDGTGIYVNEYVESCFGDFDGNGVVETADIMMMVPHWNTACGDMDYDATYDVDGDCDIDLADIMQVVAVWGTVCP
jgi:hypothetical protein